MNETLDELANNFVQIDCRQVQALKDLQAVQAQMLNLQNLRNTLREKLGKFVGATTREKLVIVGSKVIRIKFHEVNDLADVEIHDAHVVK